MEIAADMDLTNRDVYYWTLYDRPQRPRRIPLFCSRYLAQPAEQSNEDEEDSRGDQVRLSPAASFPGADAEDMRVVRIIKKLKNRATRSKQRVVIWIIFRCLRPRTREPTCAEHNVHGDVAPRLLSRARPKVLRQF